MKFRKIFKLIRNSFLINKCSKLAKSFLITKSKMRLVNDKLYYLFLADNYQINICFILLSYLKISQSIIDILQLHYVTFYQELRFMSRSVYCKIKVYNVYLYYYHSCILKLYLINICDVKFVKKRDRTAEQDSRLINFQDWS